MAGSRFPCGMSKRGERCRDATHIGAGFGLASSGVPASKNLVGVQLSPVEPDAATSILDKRL
jgi:hypothetical protein